jgi:translation initiation factor 2 beta subunit (eIF-2beta)/eIF-5
MAQTTKVTYEQVVKLAEQLNRDEQQALIAHLQKLLNRESSTPSKISEEVAQATLRR